MTPTILVAFAALVMATLAGTLLGAANFPAERDLLRSQWPDHPSGRRAEKSQPGGPHGAACTRHETLHRA